MSKSKRKAALVVNAGADKKAGRPISEALGIYDKSTYIPKRIKEGIEKIGTGCYLREGEFMRLCDVKATGDFARYREEFADFYVEAGGRNGHRLWFGSKKDAAEFKERMS